MVLTPNDRAKTQNSKDIGAVREPVRYGWLSAIVSTVGAELSLPIVGRHASGRPSRRSLPTSRSEKAAGRGSGDTREQAPLPTAEERNLGAGIKPRNTALRHELGKLEAGLVVIVADRGRGG